MVNPKTMAYIGIIAHCETKRVFGEKKELPEGMKMAEIISFIKDCIPETVAAEMDDGDWFLLGKFVGETARDIRGKCAFHE